MDEDAPKLQVRLVGRDGRRRYDPASRDRFVAACLEPGVSVSRLAREHGVNANLVRKWIKKAMEERPLPSGLSIRSGSDCSRYASDFWRRFSDEERAVAQVVSGVQGECAPVERDQPDR